MKENVTKCKFRLLLAIALCCLCAFASLAGERTSRLNIGTGLLYQNGWDATIAVERERSYHNIWEYYGNFYLKWKTCPSCGHICKESLFHNYRSWTVGMAYKPCTSRGRNSFGNLRIGAGVGSDTNKFIGSITVGYEKNYCLRGGWHLYWTARTEYVFNGKDHWRTGIGIGFKVPM